MYRCRIPLALSRNAMAALSANAAPTCNISTQTVIDKTKHIITNTAMATKEAAKVAKEKVENVVGSKEKRKANRRIHDAEELAKEDYITREKTGDPYGPGSFGEKLGIPKKS